MSTLPAGYKQTEIGVIPEDWNKRSFGSFYSETSRNGIYKTAEFQGKGTRIVNMGEMFGYEFISNQDMNRVMLSNKELLSNALQDGDLLFGRRSVVPSGAGKCSLVIAPQEPLIFESSIIRVRLNQEKAYPLFLYYFFASSVGRLHMSSIIAGTNIKGIRSSELKELEISLPTKAEQQLIATALSDTDALIESLEKLIAKKRQIKQGMMHELLTRKKRLPGFSGEWKIKRLGDVCHISTGNKDVNEGNLLGQYPFFTCARVNTFSDSYSFEGEAILIAGNGEVGNLNYYNGKFEAYQRTYVLQNFRTNVSYLWQLLSFCLVDSLGVGKIGSSIPYIKKGNLTEFEFQSPIDITEQTAIATILSDMDAEITALEERLEKTRTLKSGMMHELLTGRIRLI